MFEEDVGEAGRLRVKICGITNPDDARVAIDAGADALGFNGYRGSKRFLELKRAGEWIEELPAQISRIAVLVNPSWEEAIAISALPCIDALQLHGTETPQFCARLAAERIRFGKALPADRDDLLAAGSAFRTATIVLDSSSGGNFGGTGATFPWSIGARFVRQHPDIRVILAGGLTPGNVAEAIRVVRPFGVDVTSGVERSPGRKDHRLLRSFIDAARSRDAGYGIRDAG